MRWHGTVPERASFCSVFGWMPSNAAALCVSSSGSNRERSSVGVMASKQIFLVFWRCGVVIETGPLRRARAIVRQWISIANSALRTGERRTRLRSVCGGLQSHANRWFWRSFQMRLCLFAPADAADIRRQAGNANGDPSVFRQPGADRLHALANRERGFDIRPQRSDLSRFGGRLFRAVSLEAGTSVGDPVSFVLAQIRSRQRCPLITKGFSGGVRDGRSQISCEKLASRDGLRQLTTRRGKIRRYSTEFNNRVRLRQAATFCDSIQPARSRFWPRNIGSGT
jgi:hypothetical protein